ncbi:MAG: hypothetical protein QME45_03635 [Clostridiales bacterium]|nr:hypothetical protein [Clostridiales bacterium]
METGSTGNNFADIVNPGYITEDYTQLVQTYYSDQTYLADLLAKLAGTYNVLVNSADVINKIALSKKSDIDDALDRADDVGKLMDKVINMLEIQTKLYAGYIKMKNDFIMNNLPFNEIIKSDIDHHIKHEHHHDSD